MKKMILATLVVLMSVNAYALEFKRLTTISCKSDDGATTVLLKYDSSVNPFSPYLIAINNEKVTYPLETHYNDRSEYKGELKNGDTYLFNELHSKSYKTSLEINDQRFEVNCKVKTRFSF